MEDADPVAGAVALSGFGEEVVAGAVAHRMVELFVAEVEDDLGEAGEDLVGTGAGRSGVGAVEHEDAVEPLRGTREHRVEHVVLVADQQQPDQPAVVERRAAGTPSGAGTERPTRVGHELAQATRSRKSSPTARPPSAVDEVLKQRQDRYLTCEWMRSARLTAMAAPSRAALTILLSTFDGERHLDEQLRSVRAQSFEDWTMLCRDDGSVDGTRAILAAHAADDERISVVVDDHGPLGPAGSFFRLLELSDGEMFAFCDQDDVWERHKLAWSIDELRRAETPIAAVYTDAWVADENAAVVRPSALADRGVRRPPSFGELLMVNAAIGATMVGTRALADAVTSLDHEMTMHDWWTALVAAYAGELRLLAVPTMRWRRHATTVTGGAGASGSIGRSRRNEYLAWSIAAARILADSGLSPRDDACSRAVVALAAMDESGIGLRSSLVADRAGARAWPLRRRLAVHAGTLFSD